MNYNRLFSYMSNISNIKRSLVPVKSFLHKNQTSISFSERLENIKVIVEQREFKPRKDCEPVTLTCPIDWEAKDRIEDRNWRMQLQGWAFFHPIMYVFDEYDNKQGVVNFLLEFAEDWWQHYQNDPDDIVTSRMPDSYAWYDMSVGFRALVLGFFLNRIEYFSIPVTEEKYKLLQNIGKKLISHLGRNETFSLNNHGLFQIQGLMSLNEELVPENYREIKQFGLEKMEALISSQFDGNGIHLEHSPHYHFYVCNTFESFASSGWYKDSETITSRLTLALERKKWIVDPLKRPVCVGDSILTVQDSVSFPDNEGDSDHLCSDFNDSGYAVVRSNWKVNPENASMLFMMGMYHNKTHKHRDCLSFDWFDQGERILCDGGKYGYQTDKFRQFFLSYKAHNTVEIEAFDILKIKPYNSAIKVCEHLADGVFVIHAALNYPAINHERKLYFKPGQWLVVSDELLFARTRWFKQWFHLESDYKVTAFDNNGFRFTGEKGRKLFVDNYSKGTQSSMYVGDHQQMQGFVSKRDYKYDEAVALCFSGSEKQSHLVASFALTEAARLDAFRFICNQFDDISIESAEAPVSNLSAPLADIEHFNYFASDDIKLPATTGTIRVFEKGLEVNAFIHRHPSKRLVFLFPGASNRKKGYIDFQRYSWAEHFDANVVVFSDPTITASNNITLGWFQGTADQFGLTAVQRIMDKLIKLLGVDESSILLFGSSAGGFASLKLAEHFTSAKVIAINPQIYLYNYTRSFYEKMLSYSYSGYTEEKVLTQFKERITVNPSIVNTNRDITIFQNTCDERHLNRHLNHFIKNIQSVNYSTRLEDFQSQPGLNVVIYTDEFTGHAPPSKDVTFEYISHCF